MTVGELIELLEQHPKNIEVLVDCSNIDDSYVEVIEDFYTEGSSVLNIVT